ncbi:MAG: hypothetical protein FWC70_10580 [Defluviitaleaceae bacterium]|nr:hypothetical protein [Defluviitaleaceae bacterium]
MKEFSLKEFNWALLIGCCIIAVGISHAGALIGRSIPHAMHGNFHGSFSAPANHEPAAPREFMREFEAANFLAMHREDFVALVEAGELAGTYAVFDAERPVWARHGGIIVVPSVADENVEWREHGDMRMGVARLAPEPTPLPEMMIVEHRVFCRERLTEWMHERIQQ